MKADDGDIHRGSCLCGETVFEVQGPLPDVVTCHCTQCRKQTGHYWASTSADMQDFRLLADAHVRWYRSSGTASRAFCTNCGSTLFWRAERSPERISIAAGVLDGSTGLRTEGHIFCADKGDYYELPQEGYRRAQWK
jgi:hypothetical protein